VVFIVAIGKPMTHPGITLDDKYTKTDGVVLMSGIQALVRIAMDQRRRDLAAGLNTAGYISGYRGSPLGSFDLELGKAKALLDAKDIVFQPGINEDLAASAIWGTQQVALQPGARHDGVFGIWYGKAPGVDRSGDAFKHANGSGTASLGGVLAIAGDDHRAKSSSFANQSEFAFVDAEIPVLNPASVEDVLHFGLAGIAMSRFTGLWVSLIAVADTMDSMATVRVDGVSPGIIIPGDVAMPIEGLNVVSAHTHIGARLKAEERIRHFRIPAAQKFARANHIDNIVLDGGAGAHIGIAATGKAYADLRQALELLGIDDELARKLGFRIYKIGMPWPLEPEGAMEFSSGLERVLVVEHKRPLIEPQLKELFYHLPEASRPQVLGKRRPDGKPLLSDLLDLEATDIAEVIIDLIPGNLRTPAMHRFEGAAKSRPIRLGRIASKSARIPFYCSGCPHNASTRIPDGARAMPGVGCHIMAQTMDRTTDVYTHMGGEGAPWLGQAPFTDTKHMFVNLGDGTYNHSGILAIRAAVAAGHPVTFKLLYNDAVAMTGGQAHDSPLDVPSLTHQLAAEGIERIHLLSETPEIYGRKSGIAANIPVEDRSQLDRVQKELADYPGVSVLIFDQTCAAEKRRRRKRGQFPDPGKRLFINDAVCDDCGDCNRASNCISVEPLATEFGRKRAINQSSCNLDFTCGDGFCPSFVSVVGGRPRRGEGDASLITKEKLAALPEPQGQQLRTMRNILLAGVGGTGVTTVSALLAMAAHIDGASVTTMDMTGLAQKGGAVLSHVRVAPTGMDIPGSRIPASEAHALLAFDLLSAAGRDALAHTNPARTDAVLDTDVSPSAWFVGHQEENFEAGALEASVRAGCREADALKPKQAARRLLGDAIYANVLMLGAAFQKGLIPISSGSIEAAITLNGVATENNLTAFRAGRLMAHDRNALMEAEAPAAADSVDDLIKSRAAALAVYQNASYAQKFVDTIRPLGAAEQRIDPASEALTRAAVNGLYKVMAYKDEYEVARAYTDPAFRAKLDAQFEGDFKLRVKLAPPLISRRDPHTGHSQKREFGPWIFTAFRLLSSLKCLRGTRLDPFGYSQERRTERTLIPHYRKLLSHVTTNLTEANLGAGIRLAGLAEQIKGFGHVKNASIEAAMTEEEKLLTEFDTIIDPPAEDWRAYA